MNAFGRRWRTTIFGESHGLGVGAVVDGVPPGLPIDLARLQADLDARKPGGPLASPRAEPDRVEILSGTLPGGGTAGETRTPGAGTPMHATGAPLALWIRSEDARSQDYAPHLPRPGHADWTQHVWSRGHADLRGGGHASGRMTAPLVAAGSIAQGLLDQHGIRAGAHLHAVGDVVGTTDPDARAMHEAARSQATRSAHTKQRKAFTDRIETARRGLDSVGGIVAFRAEGLPPGAGDPFFDSIESLLSHLLFAVPGVKGVEFGEGFASSRMTGSQHNDAYALRSASRGAGPTTNGIHPVTNHAGGILGGRATGEPITGRVAFKPASSIPRPQATVDLRTGEPAETAVRGRHDPCIAVRGVLAVEACLRLVLADLVLQAREDGHLPVPASRARDYATPKPQGPDATPKPKGSRATPKAKRYDAAPGRKSASASSSKAKAAVRGKGSR